ncbi:MAG: hypothetical protein M0025_08225 [Elusimicrobia bacterium]|nr:hypothetical protein [Elusimicrobiota bacterium]MDA8244089.1 hypothetical protein [Elusimicrobiota bacterium]
MAGEERQKVKDRARFGRFSAGQRALLRRLDTPRKIQDFLDYELRYNDSPENTCLSPLEVLKLRRAHCIEGAMLAAAAFMFHGRRPLLMDLRADASDDDHVVAPFVEGGRWGAVAQSHFCGLRYREPVYASYAELARSYFEFYYNSAGRKTLREFSAPLNAASLRPEWLDSGKNVFFVGRSLDAARHYRIVPYRTESSLRRADSLLLQAEVVGGPGTPLVRRRPRPYSEIGLRRGHGRPV